MNKVLVAFVVFFVACAQPGKQPVAEGADVSASAAGAAATGPGVKSVAPVLTDLQGKPISLADYQGQTVFLNFWATWCGPCIQEMPSIEKAQAALAGQKVVFLLASSEEPSQIEAFRHSAKAPALPFIRLTNLDALPIDGLPTTYIYGPDGQLAFSETGTRQWNDSSSLALITSFAAGK